jgi:hypothetical protein
MSKAAELAKFGGGISGGILQVQYTQFDTTSIISCGSNTDTEISSLAVNITPVSTNSIIKIEAMVNGEWADAASIYNRSYISADASSTPESAVYSYFDTPSTTSQVTYKVGVNQSLGSAVNWYLNRNVTDSDVADQERGISMICVTEIQA